MRELPVSGFPTALYAMFSGSNLEFQKKKKTASAGRLGNVEIKRSATSSNAVVVCPSSYAFKSQCPEYGLGGVSHLIYQCTLVSAH